MSGAAIANVQACWPDPAPDWVIALAKECDRTSQKVAGTRIGYSAGTVNAVLKASYKGDLKAVEQAVRGALLAETVLCPVVGDLAKDQCLRNQRLPFAPHNPVRIALYRACRTSCPHAREHAKKESNAHAE
ncbi:transcriptional regulator [Telmatospirillum sp. J64-1]|uniref:transcriptional regulator n=1 Tax=Telmatospirillum sp. J64-1 TaxID=2502183 RepID=UPI00115DA523|nr:transcriptional regulator [Telmatospirillum sp. J64-1]